MMMFHYTASLLLILLCTVATLPHAKCTSLDNLSREVLDWCSRHIMGNDPDPSVHYCLPAGHPWRPTAVDVCQGMPDPAVCQVLHYEVPFRYVPTWWNGSWLVWFPVWRKQDEKDLHWQLVFGNSKGAGKFDKKDFRFHTIVNNGTDDLQITHTVHAWYHKFKIKGRPTRRVLYFEFQDVIVRPVVKREDEVPVAVLGDVLLHWKRRDCSLRIPIFRIDLVQAEYLDGAVTKKANFLGEASEHRYWVNRELDEAGVPVKGVDVPEELYEADVVFLEADDCHEADVLVLEEDVPGELYEADVLVLEADRSWRWVGLDVEDSMYVDSGDGS